MKGGNNMQTLEQKVKYDEIVIQNMNSYTLSLEYRIMALEKKAERMTTIYVVSVITFVFIMTSLVLLA